MTGPDPTSPGPSDVLVVSPLAGVRWVSGRLEISAAGAPVRLTTTSVDVVAVLHAFARPHPVREVQAGFRDTRPDDFIRAVSELRAADVLLPPVEAGEISSHNWDRDSLAFHRRSRAAVARTGAAPSSPAVPPSGSGKVIELDREPEVTSCDFRSVLEARSSRRSWRAAPMSKAGFGGLLWLSARNRANGNATGESPTVVSRPYPSGGASYSLELYPVLAPQSVDGVPAGLFRYLPEAHALETISTCQRHCDSLLAAAAAAVGAAGSVPATIVVTSRFERVSSSYGGLAYSLVLREVGGLLQTIYLAAECLGLAACAAGGGPVDSLVGQLIGAPDLIEPVVGEMVVGLRAG